MTGISSPYRYQYETVAASQAAQVLGGTGATGDYLHRLVISVITAATGTVTILDGATSIVLSSGTQGAIGVISIEMNMISVNGAWAVTTGAGATVIGVGIFSA